MDASFGGEGSVVRPSSTWLLGLVMLLLCAGGCNEGSVSTPATDLDTAQMSEKICPKCQRRYFAGERFCNADRTELVDASVHAEQPKKVCPVCGRQFPATKNFCTVDGAPLEVTSDSGVADGGSEREPTRTPLADSSGNDQKLQPAGAGSGDSGAKQRLPASRRAKVRSSHDGTRIASRTTVAQSGAASGGQKSRIQSRTSPTPTPRPLKTWSSTTLERRTPTPVPYRMRSTPTPRPTQRLIATTPEPVTAPVATPTPYPPPPTPVPIPVATQTPAPVKVSSIPRDASIGGDGQVRTARSLDEILSDFDATSAQAIKGKLDIGDVGALNSVPQESQDFTRARTLVAMNFKGRDNARYHQALQDILSLPENQYNPVYNLEMAEYYLLSNQFEDGLKSIEMVKRYKQRFPRGVYFNRVARMYEVQAKAFEGQFNQTEDVKYLDKAIRTWKRYKTHVAKKNKPSQLKLAEDNIAKLIKIRGRML